MRTMNGVSWSVAAAAVLMGTLVTGCSIGERTTTWAGDIRDFIGSKAEVACFAGVDDLSVRDGPKLSAKLVGKLALHQKVFRSTIENGYARVRVPDGSLDGWVIDAKLLRELPSDDTDASR